MKRGISRGNLLCNFVSVFVAQHRLLWLCTPKDHLSVSQCGWERCLHLVGFSFDEGKVSVIGVLLLCLFKRREYASCRSLSPHVKQTKEIKHITSLLAKFPKEKKYKCNTSSNLMFQTRHKKRFEERDNNKINKYNKKTKHSNVLS